MHKSTEKKLGLRHIRRHKLLRLLVIVLGLGAIGGIGATAGVIGAYYFVQPSLPDAETIRDIPLQIPLRIFSRDGYLMSEVGERRRIPITYEEVPEHVVQAFIAAEDQRFFVHPGVDYRGILRAFTQLATSGGVESGGSTLTQQLARSYFLSLEQSFVRKFKEASLAVIIEREYSKEEIMAFFLNKMFFGQRAYGVAAASQVFFNKNLADINVAEAATLAGVLPAPSRYNPVTSAENAQNRRGYVLGRMLALGFIDDAEYEEAMAFPVESRMHGAAIELNAPYVAEMVRADMQKRYGDSYSTDGYVVVTSLDSRMQKAANYALRNGLLEFTRRRGYRGPIQNVELTDALLATPYAEWPAEIRELLKQYAPGGLSVALVTAVHDDNTASIMLGDGEATSLPWSGIRWANPFIDRENYGPAPETAAEVLSVGDLIYVMPTTKSTWALAQVPEAQGAVVSVDPFDGAISALTGGFDFTTSKFNRAVQAYRQPGSSFKPFIYSAALEHGNTPATVVLDAPVVINSSELEAVWRPLNYSGRFYGPTRLREALKRSMNLVSVRLLLFETGVGNAVRHIKKFGFGDAALPHNGSLALGGGAASPLDMAQGYAVLANGGHAVKPYVIDAIYGPEDETLYRADPAIVCDKCVPREPEYPFGRRPQAALTLDEMAEIATVYQPDATTAPELFKDVNVAPQVISPQNAFLIQDMMRDVVRAGTGRRAMALGRNDLSGKTGTSNDRRDAWFGGFNADLAMVVWVGYDDDLPLGPGEEGSRTALPIWVEYARIALDGVPENPMPMPEGIVSVLIDSETGCPAKSRQRNVLFEVFREGRVPKCDVAEEAPDIFNDAAGIDAPPEEEAEEETEEESESLF
ncbi:MAG: PBP1A family penicillin-binding protein [Chromatiales bacterium]|nr:MAG: PBP1A family penicillin-binding protein [Chromatiales bacterium]